MDSEEPESTETEQAVQYLLTAEDAELLQEILNHSLSHQSGEKRKFRFQDLKFTRQLSTFQNLETTAPQFHGFFVLFWMGVTLMLFRLAANNWRTHGSIWGNNEIIRLMMDKDVMVLGLTDLLLCWSTGFCLILQRVVLKGYIRWNGLGWLIQNVSLKKFAPNPVTLLTHVDLANYISWSRYMVDIPSRLAVDTHGLYRIALLGYADEATQLCSLQWLLYVNLCSVMSRS